MKCLYLDNGVLRIKKMFDVGDILIYVRGPKVLVWAKGTPILSAIRGLKGPTWLTCPELCWTTDQAGMVKVMKQGKALLLRKLLNRLSELGDEADGIAALKQQADRMTALQAELDEKTKQLVETQQIAAKESAERITAEATLTAEREARERAEAAAAQERQKREALLTTRAAVPAAPANNNDKGKDDKKGTVSQAPNTSKRKPTPGAERKD